MTRLEFGQPTTPEQAILRLPEESHPDYKIAAGVIEHLVHFRNVVEGVLNKEPDTIPDISLDERWIPLNLEDIKLLEKASFRRDLQNAITISWEYIPLDSKWAGMLQYDDNDYRWWQVTELLPSLKDSSLKLVCVESNSEFSGNENFRFNENSDFNILILTFGEFDSLKQELTRNR